MTQQITLDELERYLWQAAVDLRGQIDAAAYKDYIFPLVFFKRICDVRDEEYAGYEQEGGKEFADMMMQDSPIQIPLEAHSIRARRLMAGLWEVLKASLATRPSGPIRTRCQTLSSAIC